MHRLSPDGVLGFVEQDGDGLVHVDPGGVKDPFVDPVQTGLPVQLAFVLEFFQGLLVLHELFICVVDIAGLTKYIFFANKRGFQNGNVPYMGTGSGPRGGANRTAKGRGYFFGASHFGTLEPKRSILL